MARESAKVQRVFHALGDPTRRAIVDRLSRRPASATDLAVPLALTLAAVVQHLKILEQSGLVKTEKVGRTRTCRLEPDGLSVVEQWVSQRRSEWERRLDRLGDILAD